MMARVWGQGSLGWWYAIPIRTLVTVLGKIANGDGDGTAVLADPVASTTTLARTLRVC